MESYNFTHALESSSYWSCGHYYKEEKELDASISSYIGFLIIQNILICPE